MLQVLRVCENRLDANDVEEWWVQCFGPYKETASGLETWKEIREAIQEGRCAKVYLMNGRKREERPC